MTSITVQDLEAFGGRCEALRGRWEILRGNWEYLEAAGRGTDRYSWEYHRGRSSGEASEAAGRASKVSERASYRQLGGPGRASEAAGRVLKAGKKIKK